MISLAAKNEDRERKRESLYVRQRSDKHACIIALHGVLASLHL